MMISAVDLNMSEEDLRAIMLGVRQRGRPSSDPSLPTRPPRLSRPAPAPPSRASTKRIPTPHAPSPISLTSNIQPTAGLPAPEAEGRSQGAGPGPSSARISFLPLQAPSPGTAPALAPTAEDCVGRFCRALYRHGDGSSEWYDGVCLRHHPRYGFRIFFPADQDEGNYKQLTPGEFEWQVVGLHYLLI